MVTQFNVDWFLPDRRLTGNHRTKSRQAELTRMTLTMSVPCVQQNVTFTVPSEDPPVKNAYAGELSPSEASNRTVA